MSIKNTTLKYENKILYINNKPINEYRIISKGEWFIKGTEVKLECYVDGIVNIMEGWIIDDYTVRKDEEMSGIDEFMFIDKLTNEIYEFDPELLGIDHDGTVSSKVTKL